MPYNGCWLLFGTALKITGHLHTVEVFMITLSILDQAASHPLLGLAPAGKEVRRAGRGSPDKCIQITNAKAVLGITLEKWPN